MWHVAYGSLHFGRFSICVLVCTCVLVDLWNVIIVAQVLFQFKVQEPSTVKIPDVSLLRPFYQGCIRGDCANLSSQVSQNAFRTNQRALMAERGKPQNFKILLSCHETQLAITKQPTFMPTCCVVSFYWWWIMNMLCDLWCLNHTCKLTFQPGKFWWHVLFILPPHKACNNLVFTLCKGYNSAVPKRHLVAKSEYAYSLIFTF